MAAASACGRATHAARRGAQVKTEVEVKRTATWFSSWINLANTILGAGMLGLPYALSKNGTILGSLLIVLRCMLQGRLMRGTLAHARLRPE